MTNCPREHLAHRAVRSPLYWACLSHLRLAEERVLARLPEQEPTGTQSLRVAGELDAAKCVLQILNANSVMSPLRVIFMNATWQFRRISRAAVGI